jgi:hypothetical protein
VLHSPTSGQKRLRARSILVAGKLLPSADVDINESLWVVATHGFQGGIALHVDSDHRRGGQRLLDIQVKSELARKRPARSCKGRDDGPGSL